MVGLGNPGREYRENRHNVGFMAVDALAGKLNARMGKVQFKAIIGQARLGEQKVILAKPQTFMNLSGQAISSLVRYYKVPLTNLLVMHDDLDLPLGTLRLRPGGGSAGQKGLGSTIQQLRTQQFPRLRIGIGRPTRTDAGSRLCAPEFLRRGSGTAPICAGEGCRSRRCIYGEWPGLRDESI